MEAPRSPWILICSVLLFSSMVGVSYILKLDHSITFRWASSLNPAAAAAHGNFFQCLPHHSKSSPPISGAIYTPNNISFSFVLESYIKNRRFENCSSLLKPLAIVAAMHESHVQATVICSKYYGLQVRIRSGGHDYEGLSYVSDVPYVILDMFNLRSIDIDMATESAWVQSGATLGELYYKIGEKSAVHGFPAGACPTVGIGGHFSGGGYGNLMRKYGLSVDNILDAQMVDVNGRILDRKSMGEDLFWAIRGGGGASFGVILSWKIKLVQVPAKVTVFKVKKNLEQNGTDILFKWQQVAHQIDKDLFIRVMIKVVKASHGTEKTIEVTFLSLFLGPTERLLQLMNDSFPEMGLQAADCNEMSWVESAVFLGALPNGTSTNALLDRQQKPEIAFKGKSDYVKGPLSKAGLEAMWKMMIKLEKVWLLWSPYGGRMSEISETDTPIPYRAGYLYLIHYHIYWIEAAEPEATNRHIITMRSFYDAMTPYVSKSPRSAFFNYRDLDIGSSPSNYTSLENARIYGIRYFGVNFDRLVKVKTMVDPINFWKNEQSIPPKSNPSTRS